MNLSLPESLKAFVEEQAAPHGCLLGGLLAGPAGAAVLRVTSAGDAGPGTLREAIATAEGNGEPDLILVEVAGPSLVSLGASLVAHPRRNRTILGERRREGHGDAVASSRGCLPA